MDIEYFDFLTPSLLYIYAPFKQLRTSKEKRKTTEKGIKEKKIDRIEALEEKYEKIENLSEETETGEMPQVEVTKVKKNSLD